MGQVVFEVTWSHSLSSVGCSPNKSSMMHEAAMSVGVACLSHVVCRVQWRQSLQEGCMALRNMNAEDGVEADAEMLYVDEADTETIYVD